MEHITPVSIAELLQAMTLRAGRLVLALTAEWRPDIMNEALRSGTICGPILVLPLNSCATISCSEPSFLHV